MSKFSEYIGSQFGNPRGVIGSICCFIMNTINIAMYKTVVSKLHLSEHDKILDIGYGNGYLLKQIDKHFYVDLYGIDISSDMQRIATKKNSHAKNQNRLFLSVGDVCQLSYSSDFFSAVTSINTIYFWTDPVKGLSEIYRCLKTGSSFYNVVYTKEWLDKLRYTEIGFCKYEPSEMIDFGKQVGFVKIEMIEIVKGKSFAFVYTK